MHWIAELNDGTILMVPSECKDETENILKHGLKALLRRMLRSRDYLSCVADGSIVVKFTNIRTNEEVQFRGKHAGFTDLFSALMEREGCNKALYSTVQKFVGGKHVSPEEPLDFEGSVVKSVQSKVSKIQNVFHVEITGRRSFMMVEKINNHQPGTPFVIEHHFMFKE